MEIEYLGGKYPNIRVKCGGKTVTLHSAYPYREAEKIVRHFNPQIPTVVVAGFGLGYVVEYILQNTSYDVVIYEHDESFAPWNGKRLEEVSCSPRVKLFRGDPRYLLDYLAEAGIGEVNLFIHRPYTLLFPEVYDAFHGMLVAYLSRRQINQATVRRFQKLWVRNILKNSCYYGKLPGVKELFGSARGYAAIIVGAGPSLNRNGHLLKQAKSKDVILIATDTSLLYLDALGVEADFVVSVDPQDKNALYLMASRQRPWLIVDSGASFLTFMHYPHERIFLYDTVLPLYQVFRSYWGEKGEVECGGSVSTAAFDFAVKLGCEPIIFVGQDLAYSGRQTHASHNALEGMLYTVVDRYHTYEGYNATSQTFSDRIEVRGWNGSDMVLTDRKFLTFQEWFVRRFRECGVRVVNATEGGMYLKGAIHKPLGEVLDELSSGKSPYQVHSFFQGTTTESFEDLLREFRGDIERLFVQGGRVPLEEALFVLVKQKPLFGRMIEMTMQESIQKLLESREFDETALVQLRQEIRDGLVFLKSMIEKRLLMGEKA